MAEDFEGLERLSMNAYAMKSGVVFLADDYGCGVDISFGVNPKVVIVCGMTPPSNYQFKQFAGRAQRGSMFPICTVFSTTGKNSAPTIKERIMAEDQQPLKGMEQCITLYKTHEDKILKLWKKNKKEHKSQPTIKLC